MSPESPSPLPAGNNRQPNGAALAETLRSQITKVAPEHADLVIASLIEAIQTTKRAKGRCDHCDRVVTVSVQDANAATNAIKLLLEQTEGRPGVAEDEHQALAITRTILHPDVAAAANGDSDSDHEAAITQREQSAHAHAGG